MIVTRIIVVAVITLAVCVAIAGMSFLSDHRYHYTTKIKEISVLIVFVPCFAAAIVAVIYEVIQTRRDRSLLG